MQKDSIRETVSVKRHVVNIVILCAVIMICAFVSEYCGDDPGDPPEVSTTSFLCEMDKMDDSDHLQLGDIFSGQFKDANENRALSIYADSMNIATQDTLDERYYQVRNFCWNHNNYSNDTSYDGYIYICGVEYVISATSTFVAGLAIYNENPAVQREAVCVVATQQIQDDYWNQNPLPEEQVFWYIAWCSAHEIGHCFNLDHCGHDGCIMDSAVNIGGNVHKTFCDSCLQAIGENYP